MDYKTVQQHCKEGTLGRVYILCGEERFVLARVEKQLIQAALGSGEAAFNLNRLPGNATVQAVEEACEMLPVFSDKRVVRVEDSAAFRARDEEAQRWMEMIARVPEHCVLLFVEKNKPNGSTRLGKAVAGNVVEFNALSIPEIQRFMTMDARQRGMAYASGALEQMIFQVGNDMAALVQEGQKLESYVLPRTIIDMEDVRKLCTRNEGADAFEITQDLLEGRHQQAFSRLGVYLRQGGAVPLIQGALMASLRELWMAALMLKRGEGSRQVMTVLRGPNFARERKLALAKKSGVSAIERAMSTMVEGSAKSREGNLNERESFEQALIRAFVAPREA